MGATHVIVSTHTTRHLRATLLGVAVQRSRPASVVVSIDNDKEEVRETCLACSAEFGAEIIVAWREFPGQVRVGQVRNNGFRALRLARGAVGEKDWLHFLDGDSVAPAGMLEEAERVRAGCDLLVGGRLLLTEAQTQRFDERSLREGRDPCALEDPQRADVRRRHARYVRQLRWKKLGLVKMHKPKVLGANHACTAGIYRRVDGYDETFLGAWREDDDFGRRVYLAGGRGCVAVRNVCVYHLWHPLNPQKRENWSELPNASEGCFPRAGLSTPLEQGELHIAQIVAGRTVQTWTSGAAAAAVGAAR